MRTANHTFKLLASTFRNEFGVTLVEYGIAISLAIAVGAGAFVALGGNIVGSLTRINGLMP